MKKESAREMELLKHKQRVFFLHKMSFGELPDRVMYRKAIRDLGREGRDWISFISFVFSSESYSNLILANCAFL